jgi:hypothetical protein
MPKEEEVKEPEVLEVPAIAEGLRLETQESVVDEPVIDKPKEDAPEVAPVESSEEELTPADVTPKEPEVAPVQEQQVEPAPKDVVVEPVPIPTEGKSPYTLEEMRQVIESDPTKLDTSRLTEEGMAIHKSMLAGFTPKLQERAQFQRDLDVMRGEVNELRRAPAGQEQNANPEKVIRDAFNSDPYKVLREIRAEISRVKAIDPLSDEALRLEDLRGELTEDLMLRKEQSDQVNTIRDSAYSHVIKEIPDYAERAPVLSDFATKELGLSAQDIGVLTDPSVMHNYGVFLQQQGINVDPKEMSTIGSRLTIAIDRLQRRGEVIVKAEVASSLDQKAVTPTPPAAEIKADGKVAAEAPPKYDHNSYLALRDKQSIT